MISDNDLSYYYTCGSNNEGDAMDDGEDDGAMEEDDASTRRMHSVTLPIRQASAGNLHILCCCRLRTPLSTCNLSKFRKSSFLHLRMKLYRKPRTIWGNLYSSHSRGVCSSLWSRLKLGQNLRSNLSLRSRKRRKGTTATRTPKEHMSAPGWNKSVGKAAGKDAMYRASIMGMEWPSRKK
ncbi:hypothetical protein M011DRAFT_501437 [Sporormia fimetaria CBS 119925]|uniref:Uncharacterized protein n=1 Tax=Sporormia fimetaria CBS 119925 TaxID=1340428 RepID=A0A6A6VCD9_9PLEO|nr:hypothetical protein M011DRAFT_501437 [Sporormia fimetaria CBS 119925]